MNLSRNLPAQAALAELGAWWLRQMRGLLGQGPGRAPDALIVALDQLAPPSGMLLLRRQGREVPLRRLDAPGPNPAPSLPVLLRLPETSLLTRSLTLPLAAARDLPTVLRFEMDRLTPFTPEELYWGMSPPRHDRARETLELRLAIVPRAAVSGLLAGLAQQGLAQQGLAPGWIEHAQGRIALGERARPRRLKPWPLLCAGLALAALVLPFARQQLALDQAAALVAAGAPAAQAAQSIRARLQQEAAGQAAIEAARRQGDTLQTLAALTQALPDDTYLSDLSLKGGSLTVDGQSGNAAGLIARLAGVPGLQDPSFTAPVTRNSAGTADLFALHAGVAE